MASLNLSTNGVSINSSYKAVLAAAAPKEHKAESPTHGKWVVFNISTPIMAMQRPNAESVLQVQSTGEGELEDLVEEFSEGRVQFAFVRVRDPNTSLAKNVFIAWCGDGVPEWKKGYFTSHSQIVAKTLQGYHVQINARSEDDLSPQGIIQKVADSSGSKYTASNAPSPPPVNDSTRPSIPTKPVFTAPKTTGGFKPLVGSAVPVFPTQARQPRKVDDDGWGEDAPPVTRTELEAVPSSYKPTKVDMKELTSQKSSTTTNYDDDAASRPTSAVKGGYQPVGKVDIAAIRRQARENEAREEEMERPQPNTVASRSASFSQQSGRLTSLPKPKVANKFRPVFANPSEPPAESTPAPPAADSNKTPTQLWAERKAREGKVAPAAPATESRSIEPQNTESGTGWKSSYSGKRWGPVQTKPTTTAPPPVNREEQQDESDSPAHISSIREKFSNFAPPVPSAIPTSTAPSFPARTQRESEETSYDRPPPPPPVAAARRSPSPEQEEEEEQPIRPSSPIRIAMPVARGAAEEPRALPVRSTPAAPLRAPSPEPAPAPAPAAPAAAAAVPAKRGDGICARVEYDYDADPEETNEINLVEEEIVSQIDKVDEDWWVGTNSKGERGLFPSNYVTEIEGGAAPTAAPVAPAAAAAPRKPTAVAEYEYEAAEDNEIGFPEGAKITNIEFPDEDWWFGEYNGKGGLFPANYVQLDA